jgi:hypothetical protein
MKRNVFFAISIITALILFGVIGGVYLNSTSNQFISSLPVVEGQPITGRKLDSLYTNTAPAQYESNQNISKERHIVAANQNILNPFSPSFVFIYDATNLNNINSISITKVDLNIFKERGWRVESKQEYQLFNTSMEQAKEIVKKDFWNTHKDDLVNLSNISKTIEEFERSDEKLDSNSVLYEVNRSLNQLNFNITLLKVDRDSYGKNTPDYNQIQQDITNRLPIEESLFNKYNQLKKDIEGVYNSSTNPQKEILTKEWVQRAVFSLNDEYFQANIDEKNNLVSNDQLNRYLEAKPKRQELIEQNKKRIEEIQAELKKS